MLKLASLLCAAAACIAGTAAGAVNNRPVIGILTLPNPYPSLSKEQAYLPASYVKWAEAGGAQVIPLKHYVSEEEFRASLKNINGVLFTGGGVDFAYPNGTLTQYARKGQIVFEEVTDAFNAGETFPLWGTCLGFEMINFLGGGAVPGVVVAPFDAEDYSIPLNLTAGAAAGSNFFKMVASEGLLDVLASQPVTMNAHHAGVTPESFAANAKLSANFNIWSTNMDRVGRKFVSTVEGKQLPITGTQWHPEKPVFEWDPTESMVHSFDSVRANLLTAQYFIGQTHANSRRFPSDKAEHDALIYNYVPTYTQGTVANHFTQVYFL